MAKQLHPAELYAEQVKSGEVVACKFVKQAVDRYYRDLEEGPDRGIYFQPESAKRVIKFYSFLKHYKGRWAGKPFELSPWQQFIIWNIFGFKNADGTRRFNYAYTELAKKGGKTTFAAGGGLYLLAKDGEPAAEVYSAATRRDQAKFCFDAAAAMAKKPPLKNKLEVYTNSILDPKSLSYFKALSRDYDSQDGMNPHGAIIDEYHAHKDNGIVDNIVSAIGARANPLIWFITTAGFNKFGPCFDYRTMITKILSGVIEQDDVFGIIYTLDEGDDWKDESTWIKANPNLEVNGEIKKMRKAAQQAVNRPSARVNFLTKNLNIWTDASDTWIPDEKFMACSGDMDMHELAELMRGRECYGALDLSSVKDLTSFSLYFPPESEEELPVHLVWYWLPEMTAKERVSNDNVNYDVWIEQQYIIETPGNVLDYEFIYAFITGETWSGKDAEDFEGLVNMFNIVSSAYDMWNSAQIVSKMEEYGMVMNKFGQGFRSMSTPTKDIERIIIGGKVIHGGNPVLRWNFSNVELQTSPAGDIKIDKKKSAEKVDGAVTFVMSYGEWLSTVTSDEEEEASFEVIQ